MRIFKSLLVCWIISLQATAVAWIEPPAVTAKGYPVPAPDTRPETPAAHGAHRAYAIEWWYWTGHLRVVGEAEDRFGFQSTVFRIAGAPGAAVEAGEETFGDQQLYMSHVGLSDFLDGSYRHHERVYREGWQARVGVGELDLRVGPIAAWELSDEGGFGTTIRYKDGARLELVLRPAKPMVAFGERGLSRKGGDPAAVSWYWTYTRLEVTGTFVDGDERVAVEGLAWMDHEISSSQLGSDLEGWDWTAIHLNDGTEVKAYRLRQADGGSDPWSAVYWIDEAGHTESVYADQFTWEGLSEWTSPATGLTYPTTVRITARHPVTGETKVYNLVPRMDAQEFVGNNGSNAYWEGACKVQDASGRVIGRAYLELAGYGGGLSGQLN
ncbi:MAG: carotenoid 1,2-hydratase [Verrucomicrobia bacterium]|jgi:predicted secreted hydrolase|nr:carotenoid 1,2-hydratase [Verrucomicrobiota bacterium]